VIYVSNQNLLELASTVDTIAELLTANDQILSGVMSTDDKLQLTFVRPFIAN
jgi:hypothetical protein